MSERGGREAGRPRSGWGSEGRRARLKTRLVAAGRRAGRGKRTRSAPRSGSSFASLGVPSNSLGLGFSARMPRLSLEELRALAPWKWIEELEATLRRVDAAFSPMLCAPARSVWHMRPSQFERRVLDALDVFGIRRVAREVNLVLRMTPEMRRAMAHPASGSFHAPDTLSLRLDMVWWDPSGNVLRILEVDGTQHGENAGESHFFFRGDPSVGHRARFRDLVKDDLIRNAGMKTSPLRVSMLRIPPKLERPSHANNIALLRLLHGWMRGTASLAPPVSHPASPPVSHPASRTRRRSSSLPPLRAFKMVNMEEERRQRTTFVRSRRAAARSEAEQQMWRARQMLSDSRRVVRDDMMYPYPPAWWSDARKFHAERSRADTDEVGEGCGRGCGEAWECGSVCSSPGKANEVVNGSSPAGENESRRPCKRSRARA